MIVLIPSFEPTDKLLKLVESLMQMPVAAIVIVNDGSSPDHGPIFHEVSRLGALVVSHDRNRGKGEALKTGFRFISEHFPGEAVVCADSDGQHQPADILRVGLAAVESPGALVLGCRAFTGKVPLRSRFGNKVTRRIFAWCSGTDVTDTQTGLRAFSADLLPWLQTIHGSRFEYEMNMLLECAGNGVPLTQVSIDTIYLDSNTGSHFHPLRDSWRIYKPILSFTAASFASFGINFILLLLLKAATGSLLASVIGARLASGTLNYFANRRLVFGQRRGGSHTGLKYAGLCAGILTMNYLLLYFTTAVLGFPLALSKGFVEISLFFASYGFQRNFIFRARGRDTGRSGRLAVASRRLHASRM